VPSPQKGGWRPTRPYALSGTCLVVRGVSVRGGEVTYPKTVDAGSECVVQCVDGLVIFG
jgi:hypothetical protein